LFETPHPKALLHTPALPSWDRHSSRMWRCSPCHSFFHGPATQQKRFTETLCKNAFNSIHYDTILQAAQTTSQKYIPSYEIATLEYIPFLSWKVRNLDSGVQQMNPLGPAFSHSPSWLVHPRPNLT